MVTEDIDISWKLQLDHWDIRFQPNCLCWILMPESFGGLWKQRRRWAQGGAEVLIKYFGNLLSWRKRRMWPVYAELATSILWAYLITFFLILFVTGLVIDLPPVFAVGSFVPRWTGIVLGFTCLLQFAVSMLIDSRY